MATQMTDLAKELHTLRETLGLTQGELARLLGVSARTVSRWEQGESEPQALSVREIRRWLKLKERMRELFTEEGLAAWFHAPHAALGGQTPFEAAVAPGGDEAILDLLGRVEWGIPA